jgi:peptidase M28-like protein
MFYLARRSAGILVAIFAVGACGPRRIELVSSPSAPAITADELRRDLFVFAADSFGGRATGTPYALKAEQFLAARLQSLGVVPAGDSGYLQRVPLKRNTLSAAELSVASGSAPRTLALGEDLLVLSTLGPGALPRLTVDAELAFASYGIQDANVNRSDFTGLDVAGKTLVIVAGAPANADSTMRAKYGSVQNAFMRLGGLIQRQPAAIVMLVPDSVFGLAQGQFARPQLELASEESAPVGNQARPYPMVAIARMTTSGSPFLPSDWPANDRSRQMAGTRFVARLSERVDTVITHNVVGVVHGSDPARRNTYVAYGAHYDHVGTRTTTPDDRDTVFNGADDDGSGSVALLAIARAWVQGPKPPRSALFVWHIGEELGLFGSAWYTAHPTVPIDSIVAQLNADMIGRNHPDTLYVVGPGAAPNGQSKVLGQVVDSVNALETKPFVFNREWDSTTHPERIYYRSDHFNYAVKGIPIVFLTTGLHPQYHQVADEAPLIDYAKLARVSTLMYDVGIALGRRTTRPKS